MWSSSHSILVFTVTLIHNNLLNKRPCVHMQVDELMGDMESAVTLYSKAVRLLLFLLVEAPSLILNPPFSLTTSDRYRLRMYIEILNNRQSYSRSQRMAILKCEDPQSLWTFHPLTYTHSRPRSVYSLICTVILCPFMVEWLACEIYTGGSHSVI